eukprot:12794171-Alexandrium_andersonii.AAC.1
MAMVIVVVMIVMVMVTVVMLMMGVMVMVMMLLVMLMMLRCCSGKPQAQTPIVNTQVCCYWACAEIPRQDRLHIVYE